MQASATINRQGNDPEETNKKQKAEEDPEEEAKQKEPKAEEAKKEEPKAEKAKKVLLLSLACSPVLSANHNHDHYANGGRTI